MKYINLNGKIILRESAQIPIDNGAFRYGYGLFETMLVQNGAIALKKYHWDRLFNGLDILHLRLDSSVTREWLEQQVLQTVKRNDSEELCRVRLQVFAGGGGLCSNELAGLIIECFALQPETLCLNEKGLVVGIATGLNKSIDTLANLKSCNALIYTVAARQAHHNNWSDALLCNAEGHIIESTIANVFWIKNNIIHTPPLSDGCIAGVMRQHIMRVAPVIEKSLSMHELMNADEIFLTNAVKRIKWISSIENSMYSSKQITEMHNSLIP